MAAEDPDAPASTWPERAARVLARCDALAACSDAGDRIERSAFGPAMTEAVARVAAWMEAAGLEPRLDAVGNLRGRAADASPDAPTLLIGSHLDSVVDAGRFDGTLGVLAGLELADSLGDAALPFTLEVVAFCDEEGVRFGSTYFGSQALAGCFDPALLDLEDADGVTLREAITAFGGSPDAIASLALDPARTVGFLEVHIEQGIRLDSGEATLGAVDAIAGQTKLEFVMQGRAAHAGTTSMRERRDALAGAADIVLAAEAMANEEDGAVATVGRMHIHPNASNVIASEVRFTVDIRHRSDAVREQLAHNLLEAAQVAARSRGLEVLARTLLAEATRPLDPRMHGLLLERSGARSLTSYAGHDAAVLARRVPTALLFVRNPGGVSHHPDESVEAHDVARALGAAAALVTMLAAAPGA